MAALSPLHLFGVLIAFCVQSLRVVNDPMIDAALASGLSRDAS